MLNPFPELLVYGLLAPFIIRLALGFALIYLSVEHYRNTAQIAQLLRPRTGASARIAGPALAVFELAAGVALIAGAWVQIAAIAALVLTLKPLLLRGDLRAISPYAHSTYAVLFMMALSLLLSGAGAFAFDISL